MDVARAGAAIIGTTQKYILVEANDLLLDRPPWSALAQYLDFSLFISMHRAELERRLLKRWIELGYSDEAARSWVGSNDMPNVDVVLEAWPYDIVFLSGTKRNNRADRPIETPATFLQFPIN
jgi:pantothenate kinase